jgi:hypothetical protein
MYLAVLGLLFLIAGFHTFGCTLVLHAANLRVRLRSTPHLPGREVRIPSRDREGVVL